MAPSSGRADTQTVWEPYRSCTDTLPLDYVRCVKEKIRKKKVDGVVQCYAPFPYYIIFDMTAFLFRHDRVE